MGTLILFADGLHGSRLPLIRERKESAAKSVVGDSGKEGGWIAVDWDHSLATEGPEGGDHQTAGEPIPAMVDRVKEWLSRGKDVRIFTARMSRPDADRQRRIIEEACESWFGQKLPVTNVKDSRMAELWDDRAVRLERDTGLPLSPHEKSWVGASVRLAFSDMNKQAGAFHNQLTKVALNPTAQRLEARLTKFFNIEGDALSARLRNLRKPSVKVLKASDEDDAQNAAEQIDWEPLAVEVEPDITEAATTAGQRALALVGISSGDMISAVNTTASTWAQSRAAELVGMRWDNGILVPNPDANWAISATTRKQLRDIISKAFEEKISKDELIAKIESAGTFSPARARAIAKTEISLAAQSGNLNGWRTSGLVQQLNVDLSSLHDQEDECDEVSEAGPYEIDKAPKLPLHTNCECVFSIAKVVDKVRKGSPDQPRVPAGQHGGGEFGSGGGGVAVVFQPSEKMQRAMEAYKGGGLEAQRIADKQEGIMSRALGVPRTADNSAFDCRNDKVGIELKTMIESKNGKITMNKAALARKLAEAKKDNLKMFTVVADKRGGSTSYYYREGVGSFRVGSMTPVSLSELRSIVR